MAESVDCSDFCRLCLVKEQVNTPIFEELGDLQQIYIKITACLPIKVSLEDPLPKRICDECSYKLDQQYNFWNTSINAEKQLRQWLGLPEEPPTKSENVSGKIKREKDNYDSPSKRPRRNARRKAAQHVRQAAAAAIAASDSGPGEDMDLDAFTKEENDSDHDFHDNNESMEDTTYTNVGLDSEEHGSEAGPSGLQKGAVTSTNSGTDAGGTGVNIKCEYNAVVKVEEDEEKWNISSEQHNNDKDDDDNETSNKKAYKCRYCKTDCKTEQMHTINDKTIYKCKICAKKFSTDRFWHTHYHRHILPKKFTCDVCNNCYTYKYELAEHKKLKHTDENIICELCSAKYASERSLKLHKNRVHLQAKKHQCHLCETSFYVARDLVNHIDRDHYGSKYECDVCHKEYRTPHYLALHKRTQHDPTYVGKKYTCDICNKEYSTNAILKVHKRKHNGLNIVCDVCGKGFLSLASLNLHASIHTNVKQHACKTCGKQFRNKPLLRVHLRSHTGEKPFQCNLCEKRFTQRSTLVIHLRYHSGQRPYSCNLCDKTFVTKTVLNVHKAKSHEMFREGIKT